MGRRTRSARRRHSDKSSPEEVREAEGGIVRVLR